MNLYLDRYLIIFFWLQKSYFCNGISTLQPDGWVHQAVPIITGTLKVLLASNIPGERQTWNEWKLFFFKSAVLGKLVF